jgi:hypothetical protein
MALFCCWADIVFWRNILARTMGKKGNRTRGRKEAGKKEEASEEIRDRGFSGSTRYPKVSR